MIYIYDKSHGKIWIREVSFNINGRLFVNISTMPAFEDEIIHAGYCWHFTETGLTAALPDALRKGEKYFVALSIEDLILFDNKPESLKDFLYSSAIKIPLESIVGDFESSKDTCFHIRTFYESYQLDARFS